LLFYQDELAKLKLRRNNAYELILYFIIEVGRTALYVATIAVACFFITLMAKPQLTSEEFTLTAIFALSFVPLFIALSLGGIYIKCRHLVKYDERIAYLEKKIAELS
jgi:hypothetical protein